MVLNRGGMTALVDAMVFMLVMVIVIHATVHQVADTAQPSADAGEILDSVCSVKVCVSDMTDLEDDSLVYLTDLLALYASGEGTGAGEYLQAVLEAQCAGRDYCMSVGYSGHQRLLGVPVGHPVSSAVREVPVLGGVLVLELGISS